MLTYSIAFQRLTGRVGREYFSIQAVSGGGRGSRVHPYGDPKDAGAGHLGNWSFRTKTKRGKTVRGGPIPPGFYIIKAPYRHQRLGQAAYLQQTLTSLLHADAFSDLGVSVVDRGGFFIHGQGRLGSDGCIVPTEQFGALMKALKNEAPVMLRVVHPGRLAPDVPRNWAYA